MYDLAALDRDLAGTVFAGRVQYTTETGSTNTDALQGAMEGAAHGSVWLTEAQSTGRGRGDHQWHSAAGDGLYVSVLLRPRISLARLSLFPFCVGLAAAEAIRQAAGLAADLRWPNDLLIGPKKVCGILVEARTEAGGAAYVVAGIGINVHQRAFAADLATPATSLDLEAGRTISRQELLLRLLESLEREAEELEKPGAAERIPARLAAASTWIRGRRVSVHGPQACQGTTEGLDEHGFLRVRTAEGLKTVQTGGLRAWEMD
jgi:BirA family biotin operon repressor/biotin-[acetyl-CoA-carboxylase] ligase